MLEHIIGKTVELLISPREEDWSLWPGDGAPYVSRTPDPEWAAQVLVARLESWGPRAQVRWVPGVMGFDLRSKEVDPVTLEDLLEDLFNFLIDEVNKL